MEKQGLEEDLKTKNLKEKNHEYLEKHHISDGEVQTYVTMSIFLKFIYHLFYFSVIPKGIGKYYCKVYIEACLH